MARYGDFAGPSLDPSCWQILRLGPRDGVESPCVEPRAATTVQDGRLEVHIDRLERSHPNQSWDNCKHVLVSTAEFALPETGVAEFCGVLSATRSGAVARDFRDGFANIVLVDLASGLVIGVGTTGDAVFAIDEKLPGTSGGEAFTRIVDDPLIGIVLTPGAPHSARMTIDASSGAVEWFVDDRLLHRAVLSSIPSTVRIGLGIFTLHPVTTEGSRSLHGQGISATWSGIATTARVIEPTAV